MLNIICVKLGKKYGPEYVNNLYKMCTQHVSQKFNFICYTDDSAGIYPPTLIVPFVDYDIDTITHNKLFLFSKEFQLQIPQGPNVFFDLDVVIKSNIDAIVSYNQKHVTLIFAKWRPIIQASPYTDSNFYSTGKVNPFNSSCMTWEPTYNTNIWDYFINNLDYFSVKYFRGMDPFLYWEKEQIKVPVFYFPERFFYSWLYGVDYTENIKIYGDPLYRYGSLEHLIEKIPVALFNGDTTYSQYINYFKKYYTD